MERHWTANDAFQESIKAMHYRMAMAALQDDIRRIYDAFLVKIKESGGSADPRNNPVFEEMVDQRLTHELQMPDGIPPSLLSHLLDQILRENGGESSTHQDTPVS